MFHKMLKIKSRNRNTRADVTYCKCAKQKRIGYLKQTDSFVSVVTNLNNKTMFINTVVSYDISLYCRFLKKLEATTHAV